MAKLIHEKLHWTMPVTNLSHEALLNIIKTNNLLSRVLTKYFERFGLTPSQWEILALLHGEAEGLQLSDIGDLLRLSGPNITSIVDRLEEKGLAERASDPEDRRVKMVLLTAAGKRLVKEILSVHGENMNELTSTLSKKEKRELVRLLTVLRTALRKAE